MADSIRTEGTGRESPDFEFSLGLFEDEEGRLSREKSPEHGLLSSSVGNGYSSVSNGLSGRDYLSKGIGSPSPRRANEGRWSWENSSNASPERTSLGLTSSLFRKPSWSSSPRETLADTPTRESPSWSSLVQKSATKDGHNWSSSTRESPSRDTRSWSSPARDNNHQDSQSYGSHRWSSPARSSPSRDDANLDSKSLNNHRLSSPSRSSPLRDNINQDNHSNSHRWSSLSPARDTADPDTQSLGNNRWSSPSRSSPTRTTSALDSNQRSSAARDVEGSSCLGSYNRSPSRDSSNTTSLPTHDVDRWSSPTRDTPTPATHSSPRTAVKRWRDTGNSETSSGWSADTSSGLGTHSSTYNRYLSGSSTSSSANPRGLLSSLDSAGHSGRASYSDSISKSSGFETYRANSTSNDCSPDPDKKSFDGENDAQMRVSSGSSSDSSLPPLSSPSSSASPAGMGKPDSASSSMGMPRFCHECGHKYPVLMAKFCCQCGSRRISGDK